MDCSDVTESHARSNGKRGDTKQTQIVSRKKKDKEGNENLDIVIGPALRRRERDASGVCNVTAHRVMFTSQ